MSYPAKQKDGLTQAFIDYRKSKGYTQEEAAVCANIPVGTLKTWEKRGITTLEQIKTLSQAYGLTIDIEGQVRQSIKAATPTASIENFTPD